MTVKSDVNSIDNSAKWEKFAPVLMHAYISAYKGPQGDAPATRGLTEPVEMRALHVVSDELVAAHGQLGYRRKAGVTNVAAYADDDAGGFGPALQVVADDGPMLMESVTVLLNRLRLPYVGIISPVFQVRRR